MSRDIQERHMFQVKGGAGSLCVPEIFSECDEKTLAPFCSLELPQTQGETTAIKKNYLWKVLDSSFLTGPRVQSRVNLINMSLERYGHF